MPALCGLALVAAAGCTDLDTGGSAQLRPAGARRAVATIRGAGATFPQPVYTQWALQYFEETGTRLVYQPIGSMEGIAALQAGTVDFGASDIPLDPADLERRGLLQFPVVAGAVVPVLNLPGIKPGGLRLSPETLARIYGGEIARWSDPALRADNPELQLPDEEITPVYRTGASGTTWIFTHYLRQASRAWQGPLGAGADVTWAAGVGANSSEQMASFVARFKYTIGYLELAFAKRRALCWASVRNRDGRYATPQPAAVRAAVENTGWERAPEQPVSLVDRPGPATWPLTGISYILLERDPRNPQRTERVKRFFEWALTRGRPIAEAQQYANVPLEVVERIRHSWAGPAQVQEDGGGP